MSQTSTSSFEPIPVTPRRPWFQFGLKSMLLMTLISAVAVSVWVQWQQTSETERLRSILGRHETDKYWVDRERAYGRLLIGMDLTNPKHREAFEMIQQGYVGNCYTPIVETKRISKTNGRIEVMVIRGLNFADPPSNPSKTVAAVLRDNKVIDLMIRPAESDEEVPSEIHLVQGPDAYDYLVLYYYQNMQSNVPRDLPTLEDFHAMSYRITVTGFELRNNVPFRKK